MMPSVRKRNLHAFPINYRTSTLYPLLYRRTLRDSFYKHHHDLNTPKASDSLIYTEGVVICKTDEEFPKRMPKEDWVTVDVITVVAPDLRYKSNVHAPPVHGGTYMNDIELFGYHVKRAIHLLTSAAAKGADILVLGAFGCGAFCNKLKIVAKAYKTALDVFPKVFRQIEFAVYCPPGGNINFKAFSNVFGSAADMERVEMQMGNGFAEKTAMQKLELIHGACADQAVDIVVNAANNKVWDFKDSGDYNSLEVYVSFLRKKHRGDVYEDDRN